VPGVEGAPGVPALPALPNPASLAGQLPQLPAAPALPTDGLHAATNAADTSAHAATGAADTTVHAVGQAVDHSIPAAAPNVGAALPHVGDVHVPNLPNPLHGDPLHQVGSTLHDSNVSHVVDQGVGHNLDAVTEHAPVNLPQHLDDHHLGL
jgi:hypothetical protein